MKTFKNIISVTVPSLLFTFLLLELVFRFVIPATDSPKYKFNNEYGFLCFDEDQNREGTYSVGRFAEIRTKWKLNNYNWNCAYDFSEKKDSSIKRIVVIGASYVEGLLVNQDESFTYYLNEKLKGKYEVYPIGISGVPLSGYPDMIRYSIDKFKPDVIVLYNYFANLNHSFYIDGEYNLYKKIRLNNDSVLFVDAKEYHPSRFRRFIAKSAFIRYLIGNLQIEKLNLFFNTNENTKVEKQESVPVNTGDKDLILGCNFILQNIRNESKDIPVILMQDVARSEIYDGKPANLLSDYEMRSLVKSSCEQYGIRYMDLSDCFINDYQKNKKKFEYPTDAHWNPYGNKVVSDYIYNYLLTCNYLNNGLH